MTQPSFELRTDPYLPLDDLLSLYDSVGWAAYTRDPAGLQTALRNATYVVTAWREGQLIGEERQAEDGLIEAAGARGLAHGNKGDERAGGEDGSGHGRSPPDGCNCPTSRRSFWRRNYRRSLRPKGRGRVGGATGRLVLPAG